MAITGFKSRINGGALLNQITDVGFTFSKIFTGLDPSTEYAVEVASYDEFGNQSDWCPPQYATTDAPPEMFSVIDASGNDVTNDAGDTATVFV